MASLDEVSVLIRDAVAAMGAEFGRNLNEIRSSLEQLQPQRVEPYLPVAIHPDVGNNNTSLHLIKSLPEFRGEAKEYPAWRDAALFAITYYPEGSENYYIAMGILRNKISGAANVALSSFNTILNFRAIIERLDQCYSDKRPVHVLENELSVLRQGNLSIQDFYNNVDKQLTLIVNKIKMSNNNNQQIVSVLNERARTNALHVFISGLRRPLCDILFASNTKDLPSALAVAQELEFNHKRQEFAKVFASNSKPNSQQYSHIVNNDTRNNPNKISNFAQIPNNSRQSPVPNSTRHAPVPMDVDPGSSFFKRNRNQLSNRTQQKSQGFINKTANNEHVKSFRHTPFAPPKFESLNHLSGEVNNYSESEVHDYVSEDGAVNEENVDISDDEINFLD